MAARIGALIGRGSKEGQLKEAHALGAADCRCPNKVHAAPWLALTPGQHAGLQVCTHPCYKQCTGFSWVCPAGHLQVCAQHFWQQALATPPLGPGHRGHLQVRALQTTQCQSPLPEHSVMGVGSAAG